MQMNKVKYQIAVEAITPLILSKRPAVDGLSVIQSMDYITGASFRGAFIELWKNYYNFIDDNTVSEEILEKFLDNGIVFGNFYIKNSSPLPLTAITCKQFAGFKTEEDSHGVRDSLFQSVLNQKEFNMERFECNHQNDYNRCSSALTTKEGFVSVEPSANGDTYTIKKPLTKILTGHISIDPITQTNLKSQLFFEEAIDVGQMFQGMIRVPVDLKDQFEEVMKVGTTLRVGGKRTSGFGEIKVTEFYKTTQKIPSDANYNLQLSLQERWSDFQKFCKDELKIISDQERAFTITLLSDGIFVDEYYRYRTDLTPELLTYLTGIDFSNTIIAHSHAISKRISGWNQTWHTAIDDELATKMGSSYLYITSNTNDKELINKLEKLQEIAIGERTYEGFGEIFVCHPFHKQLVEV